MPYRLLRIVPDLLALAAGLASQIAVSLWFLRRLNPQKRWIRPLVLAISFLGAALMLTGVLGRFARFFPFFPSWWPNWGPALAISWMLLLVPWMIILPLLELAKRVWPAHNAGRRRFFKTAETVAMIGPPVMVGYGVWIEREWLHVREQDIVIPNLSPDLDGLRIAQLTDIHMSPFLTRKMLDRAVAMARETQPHIAVVTGDLVTRAGDPLDECLEALSKLRAEAGVFGCLGNHEIFARAEDYCEEAAARKGIRMLRAQAVPLKFGGGSLNLAGVDYQSPRRKVYLAGAEGLVAPNSCNVLLSHNPDVFLTAAQQGWDVTISGHTHGGQIRVEILSADLNVARFYTPFVDGYYREGNSSIFVSRGIGTIGIPARIGARPEVALVRLRRANGSAS